jgi:DNA-binding MarR family transcriptional regulator
VETAKPMSASVLYLYGLLRAGADTSSVEGVEEGSAVFLVENGCIGCAASVVPASGYGRRLDSSPNDLAWLTPRAWRHHEVLRQLHVRGAVIPLKFGVLCDSAEDGRAMLGELPPTVTDMLARLEGKDEWTVRTTADEASLSGIAVQSSDELRRMLREIERLPDGRAYFARKQLQKATADWVAAYVDEIEAAVHGRLAALGAEVAHMPRPRRGDRQGDAVAEAAVLVERDRFRELEAALRELEEAQAPRVRFELVGPWPPYSFASISQAMPPAYDSHSPL